MQQRPGPPGRGASEARPPPALGSATLCQERVALAGTGVVPP